MSRAERYRYRQRQIEVNCGYEPTEDVQRRFPTRGTIVQTRFGVTRVIRYQGRTWEGETEDGLHRRFDEWFRDKCDPWRPLREV
jgi:hypothetical protein